MFKKVFSVFSNFPSKHASDKTVPEPGLTPNPEPELKPNPKPQMVPKPEADAELKPEPEEEEIDPIAMLAALPKTSSQHRRFKTMLSPIKEEDRSGHILSEGNVLFDEISEGNVVCTTRRGWVEQLKKQIACTKPMIPGWKKRGSRLMWFGLFKPKCFGFSKPHHCLSSDDIVSVRRILKVSKRSQLKILGLTRLKKISS